MTSHVQEFVVNLSSDDCKTTFPQNNMANFSVRLAKPLLLSHNWRVSLAEVVITNSLFTFTKDEYVILKSVITDAKLPVLNSKIRIKPDLYESVAQLVDAINKEIKKRVNIREMPAIAYKKGDRIELKSGEAKVSRKTIKIDLDFSTNLKNILGIDRWGKAFLEAKQPSIFVYSNICSPRVVGDVSVPLLSQIPSVVGTKKSFGSRVSHLFKRRTLCRLSHYEINTIEIQLLDDVGRPPQFKYGTVEIVLRFQTSNLS